MTIDTLAHDGDAKPLIVRLAEDFAEACVVEGYVSTSDPTYAVFLKEVLRSQGGHPVDPATGIETPISNNADGLLPCPFCRSAAEFYPDGDMEGHSVMCSGKGVIFDGERADCPLNTFVYSSMDEAGEAWNRRALLTAQIVARLAGLAGEWERLAMAGNPEMQGASGVKACAKSLRELLAQQIVDQMAVQTPATISTT